MPTVKTNEKPRVVLSFQHFDGNYPIGGPKSWEVPPKMDTEKAFEFAVAKYREEMFHKKPEKHRHD